MNLSDEQINELLGELHNEAMRFDIYEYGLPLEDVSLDKMRQIVRKWYDRMTWLNALRNIEE